MQNKLSEKQFAEVMRELGPGASEEQILAAAKERERSLFGKALDWATTPLTTKPAELAAAAGDRIDTRRESDSASTGLTLPEWMPLVGGTELNKGFAKGLAAGALEGAGNVTSQLTSPLDLALTALGLGGAAAGRKGMLGISRAARMGEKALMAPLAAQGVASAAEGVAEGNAGQAGAGMVQTLLAGVGAKTAGSHAFPPKKVVSAYMKSKGRDYVPPAKVEKIDVDAAKQTADAYEAMPHAPEDPAVAASYGALGDEASDQFKFLAEQAGVRIEPWTKPGQPYANSAEMIADVTKNNRLYYFPSEAGYGADVGLTGGENLMLRPGKSGRPVNDEFRAVHDYMGHAAEGNQFGPLGEERAYQAHRATMPEEAIGALTSETRGQNSWVNFGRHLRRDDGAIPSKGDADFVPPAERPFADQKTGLLPARFHAAVVRPDAPASAGDASRSSRALPASAENEGLSPVQGSTPERMLQFEHRSMADGLTELDPAFYGKASAGAEMRRKQNYGDLFPDRSYATVKGGKFEPRFDKHHIYEGELPESAFYDFIKDPEGLFLQAQDKMAGDRAGAITLYEQMIRDRGFKGFRAPGHEDPTMADTVVLFEKTPVRRRVNSDSPGERGTENPTAAQAALPTRAEINRLMKELAKTNRKVTKAELEKMALEILQRRKAQ